MHRYTRMLLTSLTAAAILAIGVGSASAERLSTDTQNIRATWANLTLSNTAGTTPVECQVTLEGSFHSGTIRKVARALIGHVTVARVTACTNGEATIDQESLPWHITYEGFQGVLPNISVIELLLLRISFLIRSGNLVCRAVTEPLNNATGRANLTAERITGLTADPRRQIPLRNVGGFGCGLARGFFSGTAGVTRLGETARPLIRLI